MSAHNNLHALLFFATSAEQIALSTQTYNLARHALNERLATRRFRNSAVVFDLDETVFDNSAYQAWLIASGSNYSDATWNKWCDQAEAEAVPGAAEFVRFVVAAGVTPLFITSRQVVTRRGTAQNLFSLGLISEEEYNFESTAGDEGSHALTTRLFMKGMRPLSIPHPSGDRAYQLRNKYEHRIFCEQARGFEIILSLGDNLSDYAEYYGNVYDASGEPTAGQHPSPAARRQAVLQDLPLLGRDFILIPNCSYGGWLRAFEANGLGASDELANTPAKVREELKEPQEEFVFGSDQKVTAKGPKFSRQSLRIWSGPK
jgi:predicted secreted acid phosphatase